MNALRPIEEPEVFEAKLRDHRAKCVEALKAEGLTNEKVINQLADEAVRDMRMAHYNARTVDAIFGMIFGDR